jgi:hypothetical protein
MYENMLSILITKIYSTAIKIKIFEMNNTDDKQFSYNYNNKVAYLLIMEKFYAFTSKNVSFPNLYS